MSDKFLWGMSGALWIPPRADDWAGDLFAWLGIFGRETSFRDWHGRPLTDASTPTAPPRVMRRPFRLADSVLLGAGNLGLMLCLGAALLAGLLPFDHPLSVAGMAYWGFCSPAVSLISVRVAMRDSRRGMPGQAAVELGLAALGVALAGGPLLLAD